MNQLRVDRRTFGLLCELLRVNGGLRANGSVTIEEQVCMFLHTLSHHVSNYSSGSKLRKTHSFIYELAALNHDSMYWERPREGWFKCNVDVATFHSRGNVSFGAVIWCSEGRFFATKCALLLGRFEAHEAEELGVREALNWIKSIHVLPIIIEIDYLKVSNAISDNIVYPNGFGLVIDDCRTLARSLGEVTFSFAR